MDTLNVGTKELLSVYLTDRLQTVTTIDSATYRILSEDEADTIVDWTPVENIAGLRIDCLIDTTGWAEGIYKLYVRPVVLPEQPIIGPWEFGVS